MKKFTGLAILLFCIIFSSCGSDLKKFAITLNDDGIYIKEGGEYTLTGIIKNGDIIIDTKDKVVLIFNVIDITQTDKTAVNINNADDVTIILLEATQNRIKQQDASDKPKALINSKVNLRIQGTGTLTLIADDNKGIHCTKNLTIADAVIDISNAKEGIEGRVVTINSGKINITSLDDGINIYDKEGCLTVNGGEISIKNIGSKGDGIDSNGDITVTGGSIIIDHNIDKDKEYPLDYDGKFVFTGGSIKDANGNDIK